MDRRRMILIAIAIVGVIALGDVYFNHFRIFENFGMGFSLHIEGQTPRLSYSTETTYPAAAIEKIQLSAHAASVKLVADDVDNFAISARINVFAESDEAAEQFIEAARIETPVQGSVLMPHLPDTLPKGVTGVEVNWEITAPRDVAVDVDYRWGMVSISGSHAPVTVVTAGTVRVADVQGPVEVQNDAGNTSVEQIEGDVAVDAKFGLVEIRDVTGNVEVKNTAGSVDIKDVSGYVAFEGSMGEFKADRINGPLRVKQDIGEVRATNVTGEIGVTVNNGAAFIQPVVAAPVTAVVSQGDLTLSLSEALVQEYRFAFDAERVSIDPTLSDRRGAEDGYLIDAKVRTGSLRVVDWVRD